MAQERCLTPEALLCQRVSAASIRALAKQVEFTQRKRKVDPVCFLLSVVFTVGEASGACLAAIRRHFSLSGLIQLARSSLWKRFSRAFYRVMHGVIRQVEQHAQSHPPASRGLLGPFADVVAFDCTVLALPKALCTLWPATRQHMEAACKVLTAVRAVTGELLSHFIVAERTSDHRFIQVIRFQPGVLYLFDLGFVSGFAWRVIQHARAYFVSRMPTSCQPVITNVYGPSVSKHATGKRLKDIAPQIRHHPMDVQATFTVRKPGSDVVVGTVSCRVVGVWNPRTKRHQYFVTNIPVDWMTGLLCAQLYRLRWEVETFYKVGKSGLGLGDIRTTRPHVIRTLIEAALLRSTLTLTARTIAEGTLPIGTWINPSAWAHVFRQLFAPLFRRLTTSAHRSPMRTALSWRHLAALAMDPNRHRMPMRIQCLQQQPQGYSMA